MLKLLKTINLKKKYCLYFPLRKKVSKIKERIELLPFANNTRPVEHLILCQYLLLWKSC